jgi:hypothetical protein
MSTDVSAEGATFHSYRWYVRPTVIQSGAICGTCSTLKRFSKEISVFPQVKGHDVIAGIYIQQ